jgi:hypothetical protein
VRIDRREDHRLRADDAVVFALDRHGRDVLLLPGAPIPALELAAVDDVGVQRIGSGVAVLLEARRVPVAEGDGAVGAARGHAGGSAVLLAAAEPVGKGVVGGDVEHLRGGLRIPAAPGGARVDGDDGALIGGDEDGRGACRIDPDAVVIVAARRAAEGGEGLAAVGRFPDHHAGGEDDVGILRVHLHFGEVVGPLGDARVVADPRPALARVVAAVEEAALLRLHGGEEPRGARRRDADADAPQPVVLEVRQPFAELFPGRAAVAGLVEPAARPGELAVLPRRLPRLPQRGVDDRRILRIDDHVRAAGVRVLVEHALEGLAPVERAEDAALLVGPVRMPEHGDEEPLRIARVDGDLRDLLPVAQAEVAPGPARVHRSVDSVAGGEVGALQAFSAADVDDVGVRGRHRQRADGAGRLIVEERPPGASVIVGAEDAAVDRPDIEGARPLRHARCRLGAPSANGSDRPPVQFREEGQEKEDRDHVRPLQ